MRIAGLKTERRQNKKQVARTIENAVLRQRLLIACQKAGHPEYVNGLIQNFGLNEALVKYVEDDFKSRCEKCGGRIVLDYGSVKCLNCGREK